MGNKYLACLNWSNLMICNNDGLTFHFKVESTLNFHRFWSGMMRTCETVKTSDSLQNLQQLFCNNRSTRSCVTKFNFVQSIWQVILSLIECLPLLWWIAKRLPASKKSGIGTYCFGRNLYSSLNITGRTVFHVMYHLWIFRTDSFAE